VAEAGATLAIVGSTIMAAAKIILFIAVILWWLVLTIGHRRLQSLPDSGQNADETAPKSSELILRGSSEVTWDMGVIILDDSRLKRWSVLPRNWFKIFRCCREPS
jgi:hypothetical protein